MNSEPKPIVAVPSRYFANAQPILEAAGYIAVPSCRFGEWHQVTGGKVLEATWKIWVPVIALSFAAGIGFGIGMFLLFS